MKQTKKKEEEILLKDLRLIQCVRSLRVNTPVRRKQYKTLLFSKQVMWKKLIAQQKFQKSLQLHEENVGSAIWSLLYSMKNEMTYFLQQSIDKKTYQITPHSNVLSYESVKNQRNKKQIWCETLSAKSGMVRFVFKRIIRSINLAWALSRDVCVIREKKTEIFFIIFLSRCNQYSLK